MIHSIVKISESKPWLYRHTVPISLNYWSTVTKITSAGFPIINNGNRTEWSPIWSIIIRVVNNPDDHDAGVRFVNHEYDYTSLQTKLDDTMSCYQLFITITISYKSKSFIWRKAFNTVVILNIIIKNMENNLQNGCSILFKTVKGG